MRALLRNGMGLLTAASLALMPVPAAAATNDYDPAVYNLLLDCATLHTLFAQAADSKEDKDKATNSAVGFISAAESLSGVELKDYAAEINPRQAKLLDMLHKDGDGVKRLARSCAAIERVGRDAIAAAK
jgi:hypothetical protein